MRTYNVCLLFQAVCEPETVPCRRGGAAPARRNSRSAAFGNPIPICSRSLTIVAEMSCGRTSPGLWTDSGPGCADSANHITWSATGRAGRKEIAKAKDRLKKANDTVEKQRKMMDRNWEAKVSEAVKETEREKLRAAELEAGNFEKSIAQCEKLRIA